jgi:hypothetical protein
MSAVITLANLIHAVSHFLIILTVSKYFGPISLAEFSLFLAIYAPALMIATVGQRVEILGVRMSSRISAQSIMLRLIFVISAWLMASLVVQIGFDSRSDLLILVANIAAVKSVEGVLEQFSWALQIADNYRAYLGIASLKLASILLLILLIGNFTELNAFYGSYLLLLIGIALIVWLTYFNKQTLEPLSRKWPSEMMSSLMRVMRIGGAGALEAMAFVLPRYGLAYAGSLNVLAVFTILTQITNGLGIVATSQLQADLPSFRKNPRAVSAIMKNMLPTLAVKLVGLSCVVWICVTLLPDAIIGRVFGEWFVPYRHSIAYAVLIVPLWYVGGYIGNLIATLGGEIKLLKSTLTMLLVIATSMTVILVAPPIDLSLTQVFLILSLGIISRIALLLIGNRK